MMKIKKKGESYMFNGFKRWLLAEEGRMVKGNHNSKPSIPRLTRGPSSAGGIVPEGSYAMRQKPIEFKVEKVYDFKKGGRYFFIITVDSPIKAQTYELLKESMKAQNKRIMLDLGIISSFIILDDGLDLKVVPSGEVKNIGE